MKKQDHCPVNVGIDRLKALSGMAFHGFQGGVDLNVKGHFCGSLWVLNSGGQDVPRQDTVCTTD